MGLFSSVSCPHRILKKVQQLSKMLSNTVNIKAIWHWKPAQSVALQRCQYKKPFPPPSLWELATRKPSVDKPVLGPCFQAEPTVYSHARIDMFHLWWLNFVECKMALKRADNQITWFAEIVEEQRPHLQLILFCSWCNSRISLKLIIYY